MTPTLYDRDWIASRLPQTGTMCLLDGVLDCDDTRIRCRSRTHLAHDNPLRAAGRLGAACAVEYAAQAVALHAAALRAQRGVAGRVQGMLAAVRELQLLTGRLDEPAHGELDIQCTRTAAVAQGLAYDFRVDGRSGALALGRLTIALRAPGA